MRVIFHTDYDYVTLRAKNGKPRAMVAYKAGPDELTVKRDHGEAAIRDGAATEVKAVVRKSARVEAETPDGD